jgi:hypothetical protein
VATWLRDLNYRLSRTRLVPAISKLIGFIEQIEQMTPTLPAEDNRFHPMREAANKLIRQSNALARLLITAHQAIKSPIATQELTQAVNHWKAAFLVTCEALADQETAIEQDYLEDKLTINNYATYQVLKGVVHEDSWLQLPSELLAMDQVIKEEDNHYALAILPSLLMASPSQTEALETQLSFLNPTFTEACITPCINPKVPSDSRATLLKTLVNWHFNQSSNEECVTLFNQLPLLLTQTEKSTWSLTDETIAERLTQYREAQPILAALEALTPSAILVEMMQLLDNHEMSQLKSLLLLSQQAHRHDLVQMLRFVMTCKEQNIPLDIYLNKIPQAPIAPWLKQTVNGLKGAASHVFSFKALQEGLYYEGCDSKGRLAQFRTLIKQEEPTLSLKAISCFIASYGTLLSKDLMSQESQDFVSTLSLVMQKLMPHQQQQVVSALADETFTNLLQHTLSGTTSDNFERARACKFLLTGLTQLDAANDKKLQLIKQQLRTQNLDLLDSLQLQAMAQGILAKTGLRLEELTVDGVWLQRLITSPDFVAACTPNNLHQLTERYRLISRTLKKDQRDYYNRYLEGDLPYEGEHLEKTLRFREQLLQSPESKARLFAKQEALPKFHVDEAIRGLLMQAEKNALSLRDTNEATANAALKNLYTYYSKDLTSDMASHLFRMTDFIHEKVIGNKGDLELVESQLLTWVDKFLPHKNLAQKDLARKRKTKSFIYDKEHKKIGYITPDNKAMGLNNIPLHTPSGMELYDEQRLRLEITATGEIKQDNLFQKKTAALLISMVPIEELEKSEVTADLLVHEVIAEKELATLYEESQKDPAKCQWVEKKVGETVAESTKPVAPDTFAAISLNHSNESVLETLAQMKEASNAHAFFKALLANDEKRNALFQKGFLSYLNRFDAQTILANYLVQHHDKSWFNDGLKWFTHYATQKNQPDLLLQSLLSLRKKVKQEKMARSHYEDVVTALVAQEETVKRVLHGFLMAPLQGTIASLKTEAIKHFTLLLDKTHLVTLLESANKQADWQESAQYRLLLLAFDEHHKTLLADQELRLWKQGAWQAEELKQLSSFVTRHLKQGKNLDADWRIGETLFAKLIFRAANFGQTNLFYDAKGHLDTTIVNRQLNRSQYEAGAQAVAQFVSPIIEPIIEPIKSMIERIKHFFNTTLVYWFDSEQAKKNELTKVLVDKDALIDWKKMAEETWKTTKETQLPALSAYLINYYGETAPLTALLENYLDEPNLQENQKGRHHLIELIACFPNHDFSKVIFTVFSKNPKPFITLLDAKTFRGLAQFYSQHYCNPKPPNTELALLKHLGQQKQYKLVAYGCDLVRQTKECSPNVKQAVKAIKTAALVEQSLSNHVGAWYFDILQTILRWWHYGKEPTSVVKFCDDESAYENPVTPPERIRTPVLGGQVVSAQLKALANRRQLERLKARLTEGSPVEEAVALTDAPLPTETILPTSMAVQPTVSQVGLFSQPQNNSSPDVDNQQSPAANNMS